MRNLMKNKKNKKMLNEQKNKNFEDNQQIMERLIDVEPNNPTLTRNQNIVKKSNSHAFAEIRTRG